MDLPVPHGLRKTRGLRQGIAAQSALVHESAQVSGDSGGQFLGHERHVSVTTAALTAGCGGGNKDTAAAATHASQTTAAVASAAAPSSSAALDAEAVLAALKSAGLPITDSATVTEVNDGNHLLGRPGQYTSKVAFADARVGSPIDQSDPGNDAGGSIEVFAKAADAQARSDYIQQTLQKLGPIAGTEYHYLSGVVLVRVTGELPPSAAADYETAVAHLS